MKYQDHGSVPQAEDWPAMTLKRNASNSGQRGKRCQNAPSRDIVRARAVSAAIRPEMIVVLRVILFVERPKRV